MASAKDAFELDDEAFGELSAAEQRELRTLLSQAQKVLDANPLAGYAPHARQQEFHAATEPVKAFIGGNRSGKSTAGVADDLIQALSEEDVPEHLRPYKRSEPPYFCRIITPDLGHTMEVVIEKVRRMTPAHALHGGGWDKAFDKTKRILRFANESRIDFMSFEQDVNKFGGIALDRVHYDEEPSGPNAEKIREECRFRLIDRDGDELFTMTPLFGLSFVYDEVWERRHLPGFHVQRVEMNDNPYLSERAKKRILSDLSDEERRQREKGEFVHLGGRFYDEFSEREHAVDPPAPTDLKDLSIVVGIDPGLARTGVIWVAFDSENAALAFAELYPKDLIVADVAALIHAKNQEWGITPDYYVIDPNARIRATVNSEQVETEYARRGIHVIHGQNARGPGILEVKRRLQRNGFRVSRDCKNLIWEFGRYRKDPNSADEFAAIKEDDHLLDALRYVCMARPWATTTPPSEDVEPWTPGIAPDAGWLDRAGLTPSPPLGSFT